MSLLQPDDLDDPRDRAMLKQIREEDQEKAKPFDDKAREELFLLEKRKREFPGQWTEADEKRLKMLDQRRILSHMEGAMDISKNAVRRLNAIRQAEADTKNILGPDIAFDTAESYYGTALQCMNVDTTGVHPSGYRAIFEAHRRSGRRPVMDARAVGKFPEADRIRQL